MPRLGALREYRQRNFLSLRDLAMKSGVSKREIVEIEAGRVAPQPRTIRKLAEALAVHPRALIGLEFRPGGARLKRAGGAGGEEPGVGDRGSESKAVVEYNKLVEEMTRLLDGG
jgi:transcriptional regulator with XRE-family HTH domain